ncbi:MAG: hypothetical protein DRQ88_11420 [Epsilonproteobacteria bacterium]|nr:MAG: hypothetical protein DRQ88_11420 [Campylobacterota bacterium]RLA64949.1 MAG: hypothetical protein DRQ89_02690 [Campylobacterota bacterium]
MNDFNFPYIKFEAGKSYKEWGHQHGEEFRQGIKELVEIRTELMLARNPALKRDLKGLALEQLRVSSEYSPELAEELKGISEGSGISLEELVILNNYTDFRDIELPEEGCSTLHVARKEKTIAGQTWDMHGTAKNYVSVLHIPAKDNKPEALLFSLVGCVGMMGVNTSQNLIGVNNINTRNAQIGLIWPILIRKILEYNSIDEMRKGLLSSPVTSGHNYLLSSPNIGEHWEITPEVSEKVLAVEPGKTGEIFHTNHCLGEATLPLEMKESLSSTTFVRYDLLAEKIKNVKNAKDMKELLMDHDGYPKSICSHFQSGAQDPSMTCGGAVADFNDKYFSFWRGCPVYDQNFLEHNFKLEGGSFSKVN